MTGVKAEIMMSGLSALHPAGVCEEESLEDDELQTSRQQDDGTLDRRPPGDIVEVGLQEVVVLPFSRAGKTIMTPNVEELILELLHALLNQTTNSAF